MQSRNITSERRGYPLEGVTVVDLGQIYNGSYATFLMAMGGARVAKIEPLDGEHLRRRARVGGAALPFAMLNSNKLSATLNLKKEGGRKLLMRMVERADVLLENFAPGTTDRLGIGWDTLRAVNPRLIDHDELGRVPLANSPLRYEGVEPMPISPSRRLGEDNVSVYRDWLGLTEQEFEQLKKDGVI